jgi:hypothetical protein
MIPLMIMSTLLIGTLCILAYRLADFALPVMFGFEFARVAYQTEVGLIGASAVGFIAGAVAYVSSQRCSSRYDHLLPVSPLV